VGKSENVKISEGDLKGLSFEEVFQSRGQHGRNEVKREANNYSKVILDVVKEPMILLLLVSASIYFFSGAAGDGLFMLFGIVLVAGISIYQESRSRNALAALQSLTQSTVKVIREGKTVVIRKEEIVIGDYMVVDEGASIPADGTILRSNDFAVDESILTGESLPVEKNFKEPDNNVYQGTTVVRGLGICQVTAIGKGTALGKIGKSIELIQTEETPLQKQIRNFVKKMALVGLGIFLVMWGINFFKTFDLVSSLLQALTLAMSVLPEEIPVAFTTFMALGAWRLMRLGVIVKHISTVEALGSATVICTDKTGTLTENRMTLTRVYALSSGRIAELGDLDTKEAEVVTCGMWASEPIPFDPMEVALHAAYKAAVDTDERKSYRIVHEYPLEGRPPMMTHVFENNAKQRIIAAKGAPEAILAVSKLSGVERSAINSAVDTLASFGYRVLGVAVSDFKDDVFPEQQQQLPFIFKGLLAFFDPPKSNIESVLQAFYNSGIQVKIITGDNAPTTTTIARQIKFRGYENSMSGEQLVRLSERGLADQVDEVNIFTRMFPEAKLRILNALKAKGHIVAMTGDGVNDGPALKAAHIGIAMGSKGSELAKDVSSLVISDDDLARMVDAIAMGRKIYANLKKAIQYIISIHIPIILTVFLPLALGWIYPAIFTPVHVIFLELIMGPTCSIIYENEPMERNAMAQKPRPFSSTFFNWGELGVSIFQGIVITMGTLAVYQYAVAQGYDEEMTRAMVFITLVSANIFLTLVNRSFYYSMFSTLRYKNHLIGVIVAITGVLTTGMFLFPSVARFFHFTCPAVPDLLFSIATGCVSVVWFEVVKAWKRFRDRSLDIVKPHS
jgi:P-type Ca2+ transporter type 2C